MENLIKILLTICVFLVILTNCAEENKQLTETILPVNADYFIKENLVQQIEQVAHELSGGTKATCYKIVVKSEASEHPMGPWCPKHINDSKEKGGIWFENGKVYDVDGHFISNIGAFYADSKWKLYLSLIHI